MDFASRSLSKMSNLVGSFVGVQNSSAPASLSSTTGGSGPVIARADAFEMVLTSGAPPDRIKRPTMNHIRFCRLKNLSDRLLGMFDFERALFDLEG